MSRIRIKFNRLYDINCYSLMVAKSIKKYFQLNIVIFIFCIAIFSVLSISCVPVYSDGVWYADSDAKKQKEKDECVKLSILLSVYLQNECQNIENLNDKSDCWSQAWQLMNPDLLCGN